DLGSPPAEDRARPRGSRDPRSRDRSDAPRGTRGSARRTLSVELALKPRGPYSLALSARISSDATRTFRDGVLTQALASDGGVELARAGQSPDGTITIRADSPAGAER